MQLSSWCVEHSDTSTGNIELLQRFGTSNCKLRQGTLPRPGMISCARHQRQDKEANLTNCSTVSEYASYINLCGPLAQKVITRQPVFVSGDHNVHAELTVLLRHIKSKLPNV